MNNTPPAPCTPFTACWCEQHPNHPQCKNALPINNEFFIITAVVAILIFVFRKLNKKLEL
jgi:hypothetical protein